MRSHSPSVMTSLPTLATLLVPLSVASQEAIDLPGQDKPLGMEVEELFSVGSLAGDEWEAFSNVTGVAFDGAGNLYILDAQNFRVVKVGPQGQFIQELGRAGEGPGEFGMPMSFTVTASGEVRVFDLGHQGFTVFNPDGTFKNTLRMAGGGFFLPNGGLMPHPDGGMVSGGPSRLRVAGGGMGGGGSDEKAPRPVQYFSLADEVEVTTAYEAYNPLAAQEPQSQVTLNSSAGGIQLRSPPLRAFDAPLLVGVLPDGILAVVDSTTYAVKLVERGQGVVRTLRRPFTPKEVSRRDQAAERDRQLEEIAAQGQSVRGATMITSGGGGSGTVRIDSDQISAMMKDRVENMEFGEEIPLVTGMAVDWAGRIWVKRTGPRIGDEGPLDVITGQGEYLGSLEPDGFRIPDAFGPDGLAAYIEKDELDVPMVVVKRLTVR